MITTLASLQILKPGAGAHSHLSHFHCEQNMAPEKYPKKNDE